MKYDYELALFILRTLEDAPPGKSFSVDSFIADNTEDYDTQFRVIAKHMELLNQAGLVESKKMYIQCPGGADFVIKEGLDGASGLTFLGHQYLAAISNNNIAAKIGSKVKSGAITIFKALSMEAIIEFGKFTLGV